MQIKKHIPNMLTLGNLFCGVTAIIVLFTKGPTEDYLLIALLMGIAMVCDFLDGMVARLLKVSSPIGKELDSLADMVTFGVLPGMLVYNMLADQFYGEGVYVMGLIGLVIPLFSALRLAKFNVDERQSDRFFGVPTPANAFLFLALFLIFRMDAGTWYHDLLQNQWVLIGIAVGMSFLLVADIPLLALKFKNLSFADNKFRYILIGVSVLLSVILFYKALPLIIAFYIVLSIIENQFSKAE